MPTTNDRINSLLDENAKATALSYQKRVDELWNLLAATDAKITKLDAQLSTLNKQYAAATSDQQRAQIQANINLVQADKTKLVTVRYSYNIALQDANRALQNYLNTKPSVGSKQDILAPQGTGSSSSVTDNIYKYNAPMVKAMYFGKGIMADSLYGTKDNKGRPQHSSSSPSSVGLASLDSVVGEWGSVKGVRGVLRMDSYFVDQYLKSIKNPAGVKLDTQKYGFRFLYNPTTVSMAWQIMDKMDPTFPSQAQDPFSIVSTGLMSSSMEFDILLNRIEDLNLLTPTGGLKVANPYPKTVDPNDLRELYKRGTMYDIEYLFKTINGPHATQFTVFNGASADKAYLRPSPLELHLGSGMHYRVRVSNIAINHVIFNDRMVPVLSTVRLSLSRYVDGPQSYGADTSMKSK